MTELEKLNLRAEILLAKIAVEQSNENLRVRQAMSKIKSIGTRITEDDPYGEENWEE